MSVDLTSDEAASAAARETLPWVEKYRPDSLDDVISHRDIVSTITKLIDENRLPHLLFYGPPGTGKTSTILAVARRMYGKQYRSMVLELNASDDRGIDVVRHQIQDFASTRKMFSSDNTVKLVVLDEADAMTAAAQAALRRVIEKYSRNTRFCLICNFVGKIIPAIQSRCTRFRFCPLAKDQVKQRLADVIEAEHANVTPDGLDSLVRLTKGDMRKGLNILQSASMAHDVVDQDTVYLCTGNPLPGDIKAIISTLLSAPFAEAVASITNTMKSKGLALQDIVHDVALRIRLVQVNNRARIFLLEQLADLEHRLAFAASDSLQVASLVGIFTVYRRMATEEQPAA